MRFSSSSRIVTLPWPSTRVSGSIATRRSLCGCSAVSRFSMVASLVVMHEIVIEARHAPEDQIVEKFPDGVTRRRAAGDEIVDAHHFVDRIDLVEQERELRVLRHVRAHTVGRAVDL